MGYSIELGQHSNGDVSQDMLVNEIHLPVTMHSISTNPGDNRQSTRSSLAPQYPNPSLAYHAKSPSTFPSRDPVFALPERYSDPTAGQSFYVESENKTSSYPITSSSSSVFPEPSSICLTPARFPAASPQPRYSNPTSSPQHRIAAISLSPRPRLITPPLLLIKSEPDDDGYSDVRVTCVSDDEPSDSEHRSEPKTIMTPIAKSNNISDGSSTSFADDSRYSERPPVCECQSAAAAADERRETAPSSRTPYLGGTDKGDRLHMSSGEVCDHLHLASGEMDDDDVFETTQSSSRGNSASKAATLRRMFPAPGKRRVNASLAVYRHEKRLDRKHDLIMQMNLLRFVIIVIYINSETAITITNRVKYVTNDRRNEIIHSIALMVYIYKFIFIFH